MDYTGVKKYILIHRVVYILFCSDILEDNMLVNHIDRNPYNNYYKNLRKVTASQNCVNKSNRLPFIAYNLYDKRMFVCDNFTLFSKECSLLYNDSFHDSTVKKTLIGYKTYKNFIFFQNNIEKETNINNDLSYFIEIKSDNIRNNIIKEYKNNYFSETIETNKYNYNIE